MYISTQNVEHVSLRYEVRQGTKATQQGRIISSLALLTPSGTGGCTQRMSRLKGKLLKGVWTT